MPPQPALAIRSELWSGDTACLATTRPLQRWEYVSQVDQSSDWALALLPDQPSSTWIISLHGHGSTGDQIYTRRDIRECWLPVLLETGCGILTPNLRGNAWMSPAAVRDLYDLLNHLRDHHAAKRFIFVCGSMGATGGLIYATQHPADVAGMVAMCPAADLPPLVQWCETQQDARPVMGDIRQAILQNYHHSIPAMEQHSTLAHAHRLTMPLFLIHGESDATIPVEHSRKLAQSLEHCLAFQYIEQPGGNHDAPLWLMPQGLAWVMAQLRRP